MATMGTTVICRLCGKKIVYNSSEVSALGQHLFEFHPDQNITHFSIDNLTRNFTSNYSSVTRKERSKMYKTTVETWKPGTSVLQCPLCGKTGQPYIRKRRNKVAQSSLGALCLVGCWPLCFLPFLLSGSNDMHLYCKYCSNFLGSYDRKTGKLQACDPTLAKAKVPSFDYDN